MRKKTLFYRLLAVVLFAGAIALFAFFKAWTFAPQTVEYIPQNSNVHINNKNTKDHRPYVAYAVSNGWHAGVVVPAGRINALLPDIKKRFDKANIAPNNMPSYYEIGWGDRGFYEAKEITALMSLQALFNSPGSVMHVVAVHDPAKAFANTKTSQLVKFCLNEAQLANLERFIVNSFEKNASGNIISRRPGLYGDSQFFEAAGTYHFLNSCNTWAAKALRSAGFDISPTFKLFASQVMNNIDVPACQAAM